MKPITFSLLIAALAATAHAQTPVTPTTPTKFGTAGTGTGAAASGTASATTAPAKPASVTDKKFIKDVSDGVLIEQKYLALVGDQNKTITLSEEMKRDTTKMTGELKRIWTALATLATAKGAEVSQDVSKNDLAKVAKVQKEKPDKFEKEFFGELGKETKKTAKVFESAKTLQDPEIKRFAEDWSTVIKGHETSMDKSAKPAPKKK